MYTTLRDYRFNRDIDDIVDPLCTAREMKR